MKTEKLFGFLPERKTKTALPLAVGFLLGIFLVFGMILSGCNSDTTEVTVTFDIGYENGTNPGPVTMNKGGTIGNKLPDPSRNAFKFVGWFNSAGTKVTGSTKINENTTLIAKWYPILENLNIADLFKTENGFPDKLSDARKIWGMKNPLVTFAFVADPSPMVFCHANPPCIQNSGNTENQWCDECTLYVYGSNDTLAFDNKGNQTTDFDKAIQGLRVVSTKDLVNWTDHGIINLTAKTSTNPLFDGATTKVAPYADESWAPSCQWKMVDGKPKFFLYFCNSGNNTSVVVSDSPTGPFTNPGLTASMVNKNMSGFGNVSWLFDPGTMIDSDGKAYMVLGGDGSTADPKNVRRAEINDNMISITGNGPALNLPWHFEATDIWKWKNRYYINYTTNWGSGKPSGWANIDIVYVMGTDGPLGDFPTASAKRLLPNGNYGDNTNHASLFDFKGKPYLIYHASSASKAFGADRLRTAHLVGITVNDATGDLTQVAMGATGVPQVLDSAEGGFNPYNRVEAETMAIQGGVYTKGKGNETASNGISVASIDTGDWLGLYGVDFNKKASGATKFNAIVKIPVTAEGEDPYIGAIEIRLDPKQQGMLYPSNSTRLSTTPNQQSRITEGEVVGHVLIKAENKTDEGKWVQVSASLDKTVNGKHDLAFVFFSSNGEALERFSDYEPTPANDGRRRDVGFEFDKWWFE